MPYIIRVPGIIQPYITNNPTIYIDCLKTFNWDCESRLYYDTFCTTVRKEEEMRYTVDRRRAQLETYWMNELERRERLEHASTAVKAAVRTEEPEAE
jgi:hypothetical protein